MPLQLILNILATLIITILIVPCTQAESQSDEEAEIECSNYWSCRENNSISDYDKATYSTVSSKRFLILLLTVLSVLIVITCCRQLFRFTGAYAEQNRRFGSPILPFVATSQQPVYPSPSNAHYNPGFIGSDPHSSSYPSGPAFSQVHSTINDAPPSYNEVMGVSHSTHVGSGISSGHGGMVHHA